MLANALLSSDLLNPQEIIRIGGLALLIIIIFAETGLFFGFFLPGDSLLFTAGLLCGSRFLDVPLQLLIGLLIVAAIAGTTTGYGIGRWAEDYLRNKKENLFYKKRYLEMTKAFYDKHGMMAFILGRFLPIVRTFVPILAGMVRIDFKKFWIYNLLGAIIWVSSVVLAGHWLGNIFPDLANHLEIIIIGMGLLSVIPIVISFRKNRSLLKGNTK